MRELTLGHGMAGTRPAMLQAMRDGEVLRGVRHCHTKGLVSLVLADRESHEVGMRRLFYVERDTPLVRHHPDRWPVNPHEHRQALHLVGNSGVVLDHQFSLTATGHKFTGWLFLPPLVGGSGTFERTPPDEALMRQEAAQLRVGKRIGHFASDIHTMTAAGGASWFVVEGRRALAAPLTWSAEDLSGWSPEGLYEPMEVEEARALGRKIALEA